MPKVKMGVFADREVGAEVVDFLLKHYPDDVAVVVITDYDALPASVLRRNHFDDSRIFLNDELKSEDGQNPLIEFCLDYIILAWWPYIVKKDILSIPHKGVLNFHPSYLPHCAGKHPNFWSIVEKRPFGGTIHFADEGIDSGDIVVQRKIDISWEDTGKTLYEKGKQELVKLFVENYPRIRTGEITHFPQNKSVGSFHYGREMFEKIKLDLDQAYKLRDLLNLLRAKTFPPYEGCYFEDDGKIYDVRVNISQRKT